MTLRFTGGFLRQFSLKKVEMRYDFVVTIIIVRV